MNIDFRINRLLDFFVYVYHSVDDPCIQGWKEEVVLTQLITVQTSEWLVIYK